MLVTMFDTAFHTSIRDDAAARELPIEWTGMLLARVERLGGGRDLGKACGTEAISSTAGSSAISEMELALSCCASFIADRLRRASASPTASMAHTGVRLMEAKDLNRCHDASRQIRFWRRRHGSNLPQTP